jgi:hypothetical protein
MLALMEKFKILPQHMPDRTEEKKKKNSARIFSVLAKVLCMHLESTWHKHVHT